MEATMVAPWIISIATAVWFGVMGQKTRRQWFAWGLVGAIFALTSSTMVLGLCEAAFIPISPDANESFQIKSVVLAIVPTLLFGSLPMIRLWRRHSSGKRTTAQT